MFEKLDPVSRLPLFKLCFAKNVQDRHAHRMQIIVHCVCMCVCLCVYRCLAGQKGVRLTEVSYSTVYPLPPRITQVLWPQWDIYALCVTECVSCDLWMQAGSWPHLHPVLEKEFSSACVTTQQNYLHTNTLFF